MQSQQIGSRIDFLRTTQNPDGGWGYFPGKQSWLEPTAWAALALLPHDAQRSAKASQLISAWKNPDGSCRPCESVKASHWSGALAITLAAVRKDPDAVKPLLQYVLETTGEDSSGYAQFAKLVKPWVTDRDPKLKGWPWRPGNTAWIEPTAHTITALRHASRLLGNSPAILERIDLGQRMILHQRCEDGGWNYGARVALDHPLLSFPETTALALVGLAGRRGIDDAIHHAESLLRKPQAPLASAWLRIALGLHGRTVNLDLPQRPSPDVMLTAIETLDWRMLAA